ncbi:MAG: hypothetical protein QHH06_02165 [Clostridiales bacterium]|jgi:hypothetical protein|nr:hypothetical protein [Eubacteriales bacterium]MDH7565277.1 hypothetical protein [Clostridiales bacterium]
MDNQNLGSGGKKQINPNGKKIEDVFKRDDTVEILAKAIKTVLKKEENRKGK